jgi:DNA polymerase III alpha subunit
MQADSTYNAIMCGETLMSDASLLANQTYLLARFNFTTIALPGKYENFTTPLQINNTQTFLRGYTKEGRNGKVEVHVGTKAEIETDPEGVDAGEFPDASRFVSRIGEVDHAVGRVSVQGAVECLGETSVFDRQDSSEGKVLRFVLADESGKLPIVVWNEKVDELEPMLVNGVGLRLVDTRVKKGYGEALEAHVDSGTYAEVLF